MNQNENNNKIDVLKIVRQYDNQFKQHMLKLKQIEENENKINLNDINKELENIKKQQQSNNFIQKLKQNSINKNLNNNLNQFNNHTDNYKNYVLNKLMYSEESNDEDDKFDENNNSMELSNEDNNKINNINLNNDNNNNINNNINAFSFNQKINVPETLETNEENEVLNNNNNNKNNNNQTDTNGNLVNYDSNIISIKNSNLKINNNPSAINNIKNNRLVKFEPIEKEFNSKESKLSEFLQNFKNKELELKQQKEFEEQLKQNLINEENNITETHRKNLGKVIEQYIDQNDSENNENLDEEEENEENNIYENYILKNNNNNNNKKQIPVEISNQKIKSKNNFNLNAKDKINLAIKENQGRAKYTAQTYSAIQKMNKPYKKPIKKPGIFEKKILNKKYKGKTDRVAINNMYNEAWKKHKHKL